MTTPQPVPIAKLIEALDSPEGRAMIEAWDRLEAAQSKLGRNLCERLFRRPAQSDFAMMPRPEHQATKIRVTPKTLFVRAGAKP